MDARRAVSSRSSSGADIDGAGEVFELAAGVFERVGSDAKHRKRRSPSSRCATTSATEVLADASFVVVLDRISDPGNLGTIIRSAEAAGVDARRPHRRVGRSVQPEGRPRRRPARSSTSRSSTADSTTWPRPGCSLVGTSSHDAPARTVLRHLDVDLTGRIAARDGQRGRRPARRVERLAPARSAVDHDSAPRPQRVAERGDGRDGARCSKPPGNEIRRARTAGTDRSPAGMRTRRPAGPSARHRRRSRRDPADTAR